MIMDPDDMSDTLFGLRYIFFLSLCFFILNNDFYYYFRFDLYFESTVRARVGSWGQKWGQTTHLARRLGLMYMFFLIIFVFFIIK